MVLFRCNGTAEVGMGHVMRCLALAGELHRRGVPCAFAMDAGRGRGVVRDKGFPVIELADGDALIDVVSGESASLLFLDAPELLSRSEVKAIRETGVRVADIDDASAQRLECDLVFHPPVPQVAELDWDGFTGSRFCGWEWVPLRPEFSRPAPMPDNDPPVVLVTMGGSDPAMMTEKVLESLAGSMVPFHARVVCGPAFARLEAVWRLGDKMDSEVKILNNVGDMAAVMHGVDLAVASFGVTAYELAALGVPSVLLGLTDDHVRSASAFADAGVAINLGRHDLAKGKDLRGCLAAVLPSRDKLVSMRGRASTLGIGTGTERIAVEIMRILGLRTQPAQSRLEQI